MKTLLSILFGFSLLHSAHSQIDPATSRPNVLLQFLANDLGVKNLVLNSLIAKRCTRYLPSADHEKCQETVSEMIRLLDSDILFPSTNPELFDTYAPQAFLFVAFKKNLIDLLSAPDTTKFLNELHEELNDYLIGNNPDLNFWNFTLKYYKSPIVAAKVLSALCQDTSAARLHLNFLKRAQIRGRQNFAQNKELLEKFLETLTMVMDTRPQELQALLYPKTAKPTLNKNMYHFYVPLYLSQALKEKGSSPYMSYVAPMLMTLSYEFVTTASDYRYIFDDPTTLPNHEWKVRDIFAGHQGASMGAARKTMQELRVLQSGFKTSVKETVKAMLVR